MEKLGGKEKRKSISRMRRSNQKNLMKNWRLILISMEKRRIENCLEIRLISPKERASLNKNPNPNQRNE